MSVLIYIDHSDGNIKKSSLEALCYGTEIARQTGVNAEGIIIGKVTEDLPSLGRYGIKKIYHIQNDLLEQFDSQVYAKVIDQVVKEVGSQTILFSNNNSGKSLAPRVAVRLKAGLVSGAVALPEIGKDFIVRKNVFSGKAFANVTVRSEIKVIALNVNAYSISEGTGTAEVTAMDIKVETPKMKTINTQKTSGTVSLTEAETVVSAGRGLKGPENWKIVEDLASSLGAALACSRPVADAHWRPHNEHVGQTGIAIAPNLYIAIGISGAIQHLAGVNRSKVIVVINKDPEAPFFKAADYGIVGDAFEVVPKITQAVKKMKGIV